MPTPTIPAGDVYMNATTYTGNGTAGRVITVPNMTNVGFAWVKIRSGSDDHRLANTVTGGNKHLKSNSTDAESSGTNVIQAFSSNTFTVGSDNSVNVNGSTYVAWTWANGGAAVTNTAGTISSQVSANTTSGFSVVTYTGTGGTGTTTVGHGCQVGGVPTAPSMVIIKRRNGTTDWASYHTGLTSTSYYLVLNSTAAQANYGSTFISPSSSTLTIAADSSLLNTSTGTYVAYCFAQIAGYSAFGSYTGNGSSDGPFVFCGFRPRFVMIKESSSTGNWVLLDTSRSPYNVINNDTLWANLTDAEGGATSYLDILSNGFKIRDTDNDKNTSSQTYIYMAFAENPFKYANAR